MNRPQRANETSELFQLPPEEFVTARDELVAAARERGDEREAARLKPLRRPTLAAWAVNLLSARRAHEVEALIAFGAQTRSSWPTLSGSDVREVAGRRTELVRTLADSAEQFAAEAGHPLSDSARQQVENTLNAAVSDPDAARRVREAMLSKPLEYSGFGMDERTLAVVPAQDSPDAQDLPDDPDAPDVAKSRRAPVSRSTEKVRRAQRELDRRTADSLAAQESLQSAYAVRQQLQRERDTLHDRLKRIDQRLARQNEEVEKLRGHADRVARKLQTAEQRLSDLRDAT